MKTIEERINQIVEGHAESRWIDASELQEYLEQIATEQKKIDIDKACEWLKENTPIIHTEDGDYVRMIGKANISMEAYLHDFRKAMEE